jgi:hypothetical protein
MKIIEKIKAHRLVESISDEREWQRTPAWADENGDGFWVYLVPGYQWSGGGIHCIHENSPSECYSLLRDVEACKPGCECDWDKVCSDCGKARRSAGHAGCPAHDRIHVGITSTHEGE